MSVLPRLFALEQFGVKLGLDNIRTLVAALDHPEQAAPSILIAGTNGKGSVAAVVERALRASGRRTGRYTSPHLVDLAERFAIDGHPVDRDTLEAAADEVLTIEAACRADGRLAAHATFFEVTTAMAFSMFRRARVDVTVLEVGLGGRFDATNVAAPVVTAIVSIDLDHTRHLGPTRMSIAREKAGIARAGVPLVVGEMAAEPLAAIEQAADAIGAPIVHAAEGVDCLVEAGDRGHATVQIATPTRTYGPVRLGLAGLHQVANALVAVRVLEELDTLGLEVSAIAVETGLAEARWPGRLDHVRLASGAELLLDAAHNEAGARSLADHVRTVWPEPERPTLVFAAAADKDAATMLRVLAPAMRDIILTTFPGTRGATAAALAAAARAAAVRLEVRGVDAPRAALDAALAGNRHVVVAGSIFLLGALLPTIDGLRADQTPTG